MAKAFLANSAATLLACAASEPKTMIRVLWSSIGSRPSSFAAYLDPGHLNLNGEPLDMAFDMTSEFLSLIAVKDSLTFKPAGGKARDAHFLPLGEGTVDWQQMMRLLVARSYDGALSLHSEYETMPEDKLIEQTAKDLAFLKKIERSVRG